MDLQLLAIVGISKEIGCMKSFIISIITSVCMSLSQKANTISKSSAVRLASMD